MLLLSPEFSYIKTIIIEQQGGINDPTDGLVIGTGGIAEDDPLSRAMIASLISKGKSVVIPAGNAYDTDISKVKVEKEVLNYRTLYFEKETVEVPRPDSGGIIVGGLNGSHKLDQSAKLGTYKPDEKQFFNYGVTIFNPNTGEELLSSAHGTDVSAPSKDVFTTGSKDNLKDGKENIYFNFSGTSSASPIIAGIVNLIYSVNPTLTPKQIRNLLRKTSQISSLNLERDDKGKLRPIGAMVNAYEAVKEANSMPGGKNIINKNDCTYGGIVIKSVKDSSGEDVSTTDINAKVSIKVDAKSAVPLPPSLSQQIKNNLSNYQAEIGGQKFNLLEVVQDYAIFKLDKSNFLDPDTIRELKNQASSILIRNKSTGGVELTLEQAIIILIEESEINVNFNKLLYFTNTGYLNLLDTNGVTQNLFYGTIHNAIWNKTKTKIASIALNQSIYDYGIYLYSLYTTGSQLLTGVDFIPFSNVNSLLKWSPKEDKILYFENGIWVIDLNTKVKTKLTDDGGNVFFNWSNDGNKIVFSSGRSGTGRYEIYTMNSDGSNLFQVTNNINNASNTSALNPIFTKDGSRILYAYNDGFSYISYSDIYSIKIDGTDNKKLTNLKETTPVLSTYYASDIENDIKLSSDGTKIAFFVAGSTGQNLATMNVDGTDFRQITNLSGQLPRVFTWSVLENKLAYGTTTDTQNTYYWTSSIYTINADGTDNKLLKTDSGYVTPAWGIKSVNNSNDLGIKSLSF